MIAKLGRLAFLIGVALAIIAGLVPQWHVPMVTWTLAVLGIIVGLLNITEKEAGQFLLASGIVILSAFAAKGIIELGVIITGILGNIVAFVFPAALLVSLKVIWTLAKTR